MPDPGPWRKSFRFSRGFYENLCNNAVAHGFGCSVCPAILHWQWVVRTVRNDWEQAAPLSRLLFKGISTHTIALHQKILPRASWCREGVDEILSGPPPLRSSCALSSLLAGGPVHRTDLLVSSAALGLGVNLRVSTA